ncbi:UNVERIFIED_CONTAM: hypothetical protein K2H54_049555 [Gekko kuhli]
MHFEVLYIAEKCSDTAHNQPLGVNWFLKTSANKWLVLKGFFILFVILQRNGTAQFCHIIISPTETPAKLSVFVAFLACRGLVLKGFLLFLCFCGKATKRNKFFLEKPFIYIFRLYL